VKWNLWRSALAGALIGLVEVAGMAAIRPSLRAPLRVVRPSGRQPTDPLARIGVWFLDPLPDPRPAPTDLRRRPAGPGLRLLVPARWPVPWWSGSLDS
jgi:hypothetical protein